MSLRSLLRKGLGPASFQQVSEPNDAVSTSLDADTPDLTSVKVDSVRFNLATEGYHCPQVETFVSQVAATLKWYENKVYEQGLRIHELQTERDDLLHQLQNAHTQLEIFSVQGSPVVTSDGTFLTESQQAEHASYQAEIDRLTVQLNQAEHARQQAEANVQALHERNQRLESELAALREWADQVQGIVAQHEERAQAMSDALAHAERTIAQLTGDTPPQPASPAPATAPASEAPDTPVAVDTAGEDGGASASAPPPREDHVPEGISEMAVVDAGDEGLGEGPIPPPTPIVVPVDSELPPGVELPPREPAASGYRPAVPGSPIDTQGHPLGEWAPELSDWVQAMAQRQGQAPQEAGPPAQR